MHFAAGTSGVHGDESPERRNGAFLPLETAAKCGRELLDLLLRRVVVDAGIHMLTREETLFIPSRTFTTHERDDSKMPVIRSRWARTKPSEPAIGETS